MHKLMYCLAIGLLMLFSAPPQQAVTRENSATAQDNASSSDSTRTEAGLHESAMPLPPRTMTGTLVGVGLMGFVVANCKRRK